MISHDTLASMKMNTLFWVSHIILFKLTSSYLTKILSLLETLEREDHNDDGRIVQEDFDEGCGKGTQGTGMEGVCFSTEIRIRYESD